jgi:hypothetical protein
VRLLNRLLPQDPEPARTAAANSQPSHRGEAFFILDFGFSILDWQPASSIQNLKSKI